ncbi:MAG: ATP-binding protein, partial [Archangium sp.]
AATTLEAPRLAGEHQVRALTKLLDSLGTREHPALVLLDGAQWADPLTQQILERWARGPVSAERHVALVVACRTEEVGGWTLSPEVGASRLRLGALPRDDMLALITSAAGPLPPPVRAAVLDEAAGNPSRALRALQRWMDAAAGPRRHGVPRSPEHPTPAFIEQMNQLLRLGHRVASALSWEGVEQSLCEASGSVLKAEVGAVVRVAPAGPPHLSSPLPPGALLANAVRALESGGPVVGSEDAQGEARSALYVPLRVRGRVVACLVALHRQVHGLFGEHAVRMADCLATLAGVALENAESFARLEALLDERQRLYAEAHAALEAREDFLTIAAHELRTPLTSLQLQVQSARRLVGTNPEEAERKLEAAAARGRRLAQIIGELLESTHLSQQQQLSLSPEPMDLVVLVHEVVAHLADSLRRADCTLRLRTPPSLVGHWDRIRLEQVVSNLIANAIKYGPGKPIHVTLEEHPTLARLLVRDEGMGIAPEDQQRIFGRFERAVPVKHFGGFGIGLWLVQQVVAAHGGSIRVDSQPGAGATFCVELPRRPLAASA